MDNKSNSTIARETNNNYCILNIIINQNVKLDCTTDLWRVIPFSRRFCGQPIAAQQGIFGR